MLSSPLLILIGKNKNIDDALKEEIYCVTRSLNFLHWSMVIIVTGLFELSWYMVNFPIILKSDEC